MLGDPQRDGMRRLEASRGLSEEKCHMGRISVLSQEDTRESPHHTCTHMGSHGASSKMALIRRRHADPKTFKEALPDLQERQISTVQTSLGILLS